MSGLKNKKVYLRNLGIIEYMEAWEYQERVFKHIVSQKLANRDLPEDEQKPTDNHLLFCQHPHVYTLGKSGSKSNLLVSENYLRANGAAYHEINRGGDITYHGPGQLVGYPILDLDNFFTDIHLYLRYLEEAVILTLKDYGLNAGRMKGLTGVWLDFDTQKDPRKICAMGVRASRWVTMHGFALNINTDLSFFHHIVPCGIPDKKVTSIKQELGQEVDVSGVEEAVVRHLVELFGMEIFLEN